MTNNWVAADLDYVCGDPSGAGRDMALRVLRRRWAEKYDGEPTVTESLSMHIKWRTPVLTIELRADG